MATKKREPFWMKKLGKAARVRSRISGKEGFAFLDDPHIFIEGEGISGWYRRKTIARDFLMLDEVDDVR